MGWFVGVLRVLVKFFIIIIIITLKMCFFLDKNNVAMVFQSSLWWLESRPVNNTLSTFTSDVLLTFFFTKNRGE